MVDETIEQLNIRFYSVFGGEGGDKNNIICLYLFVLVFI